MAFASRGLDGWQLPAREPVEVICHNDYAPHNCVLDGDVAVGIIDFDLAHPGPRGWDIAYALYRFAPLTHPDNTDGFGSVAEQARRARVFCDSYGLDDRELLIDTVVERLHDLVQHMRTQAAAGDRAFAGHIAQGHDLLYLRDADYIDGNRRAFAAALLS